MNLGLAALREQLFSPQVFDEECDTGCSHDGGGRQAKFVLPPTTAIVRHVIYCYYYYYYRLCACRRG